jgi:GNAT superfamily N-acetyltransferase
MASKQVVVPFIKAAARELVYMSPDNQQISIIHGEAQHLELITPLFDAYRQFYQQPSHADAARSFVAQRLEMQDSVIFLALRSEQAVGFTQLYPSWSSVSMQRLWILNDLFVAPEARRLGIAAALLDRARHHAVETNAKGLVLETANDNPARHLYEQLGWRRDTDFLHYELRV